MYAGKLVRWSDKMATLNTDINILKKMGCYSGIPASEFPVLPSQVYTQSSEIALV